jgi:hypothetical protein
MPATDASNMSCGRPRRLSSAVAKLAHPNPFRLIGVDRAKGGFGTTSPSFHLGPKKKKGGALGLGLTARTP